MTVPTAMAHASNNCKEILQYLIFLLISRNIRTRIGNFNYFKEFDNHLCNNSLTNRLLGLIFKYNRLKTLMLLANIGLNLFLIHVQKNTTTVKYRKHSTRRISTHYSNTRIVLRLLGLKSNIKIINFILIKLIKNSSITNKILKSK